MDAAALVAELMELLDELDDEGLYFAEQVFRKLRLEPGVARPRLLLEPLPAITSLRHPSGDGAGVAPRPRLEPLIIGGWHD